jgi:hypothetical protein
MARQPEPSDFTILSHLQPADPAYIRAVPGAVLVALLSHNTHGGTLVPSLDYPHRQSSIHPTRMRSLCRCYIKMKSFELSEAERKLVLLERAPFIEFDSAGARNENNLTDQQKAALLNCVIANGL